MPEPEDVRSYTPQQVAQMFRVNVRSVARWAARGKLGSFRTPGGHRRYYADPIDARIRAALIENRDESP